MNSALKSGASLLLPFFFYVMDFMYSIGSCVILNRGAFEVNSLGVAFFSNVCYYVCISVKCKRGK